MCRKNAVEMDGAFTIFCKIMISGLGGQTYMLFTVFALFWVALLLGCNADLVAICGVCALWGYSWVAAAFGCNADLFAIYGVCALLGCPWAALVSGCNADLVAIYGVCALLGYS